jgi:DNA-binding HxlR family transcriptional regulator
MKKSYGCPVEFSLEFVGGKWRTVILAWLKEAPHRYGELREKIPGLSDKILTQRLRELEAMGLVRKNKVAKGRAAQAYALTARGESLRPVLDALYAWGAKTAPEFKVRVGPARSLR